MQGIAGRYLALAEGLDPQVADAIRDHYKPVGQGDDVPTAPVSVAVALADKLDTLMGFFYIEEQPTGSRDPFALRRAALGVIRLLFDNGLKLRTRWLGEAWAEAAGHDYLSVWDALNQLTYFFVDRLKVQQREAGLRHDLIDAVTSVGTGLPERLDLLVSRARALQSFIDTEDGINLLAGYKRAANILRIEEAKDGPFDAVVEYGNETAEDTALATATERVTHDAAAAVAAEDFAGAMRSLASLRAPIDAFFTTVMVNDPDPETRRARLGLLARFRQAAHTVADFSRIDG